MNFPRTIFSRRALVILGTASIGLTACGSTKDEESAEPSTSDSRQSPPSSRVTVKGSCSPIAIKGNDEAERTADSGEKVQATLGGSRVELEIVRAAAPSSILVRFGMRMDFKPPSGTSLIGVIYRMRNLGSQPVEPAYNINRQALLEVPGGKLYRSAEAARCYAPISASWAVGEGTDSPQVPTNPGKSVTTGVVFVVPGKRSSALSLRVPSEDLAVKLDASSE